MQVVKMNKTQEIEKPTEEKQFLDITSEICPMTFVRTKLKIESMAAGEILEVRLKGAEPLGNVPRSLRDHGHEILSLEPEDPDETGADAPHRLVVRKT